MANALMQLSRGQFDEANPTGWYNARNVGFEDLRAMKPLLEAQGAWNPEWDAALDNPAFYSSQQEGESGMLGSAPTNALDLSSLNGYQMAERRGDGRQGIASYFAPDGTMGGQREFQRGGAMHSGDWKQAIGTVGGVLAAGYGASALGAGAGAGAAGTGMTAAEQVAFLAANGMTDAAIASAYPSLAASAGLTGVGGGVAGATAAGWDIPLDEVSQMPGEFGGFQNVGASADAATPGGYGAGMSGAETTAYDAALNGSTLGSQLGDFFSGNGNLGDYGRVAQGLIGLYGQNRASDAAQQGAADSNALLREQMAKNQPLIDTRDKALGGINALMANPSSITSDPGYQFGLKQGQTQIDNQAAARGGYYSGQQLKASQQYGQDYAGTKLDQSLNRLMGVAGLGQIGSTQNNGLSINLGQGLQSAGNIRGSGYIGMGNTAGNTVGDLVNDWNNRKVWGG